MGSRTADTTTKSVPVISIIVPRVVDFSKKKISWATRYQTIWNPRAKEIVISDAICWATLTLATNTAPPIQWPIRRPQSRVLDGRFIFSNMADTARDEMQPNMLYQNISIHTSKFLSLVFWRVPCPEMYKSYSVNGNISWSKPGQISNNIKNLTVQLNSKPVRRKELFNKVCTDYLIEIFNPSAVKERNLHGLHRPQIADKIIIIIKCKWFVFSCVVLPSISKFAILVEVSFYSNILVFKLPPFVTKNESLFMKYPDSVWLTLFGIAFDIKGDWSSTWITNMSFWKIIRAPHVPMTIARISAMDTRSFSRNLVTNAALTIVTMLWMYKNVKSAVVIPCKNVLFQCEIQEKSHVYLAN